MDSLLLTTASDITLDRLLEILREAGLPAFIERDALGINRDEEYLVVDDSTEDMGIYREETEHPYLDQVADARLYSITGRGAALRKEFFDAIASRVEGILDDDHGTILPLKEFAATLTEG